MRELVGLPVWLILFTLSVEGYAQDVIFLHHSIGKNLYNEGSVVAWIDSCNESNHTSINISERNYPFDPWALNYPYDYWKLWIDGSCNSDNPNIECLNTLAKKYDMVIMKHCAPGASIDADMGTPRVGSEERRLENYREQYRALRSLFDSYPETKFMVWTLAPLHRLVTSPEKAKRANEFVQWVKSEWLTEDGKPHPNIVIFDFFSLVAELDENPTNGFQYCLKYEYEKTHTKDDSHPNADANRRVGPVFAQFIVDAIEDVEDIKVNNIIITGSGGATTISAMEGTLQLYANLLPEYATNDSITWGIQNGTGKATISATGLVTAVENGTVTAIATATDGSGVSGSLEISITNQSVPTVLDDKVSQTASLTVDHETLLIHIHPGNLYDHVRVSNILGNTMNFQDITDNPQTVNISNLQSGMYIVILSGMGEICTIKIVIP